jgi:hypothetical protein
MSILLRKQPTVIKEYDEKLVRRLIDKVTVYEDRFEVVFRSGGMVEVDSHHFHPNPKILQYQSFQPQTSISRI